MKYAFEARILNMMFFVAASIDVVIIKVLCICTPCSVAATIAAATAATQRLRFHFFFIVNWRIAKQLAGVAYFFRSLFLLLFEFFRVCCLHFFLANHLASDLFSITILTSTHKKASIFLWHFFRYILHSACSTLVLYRRCIWFAPFHGVLLLFMFMWLFFVFYFTFTLFRYLNKNLSLFFVGVLLRFLLRIIFFFLFAQQ